MPRGAAPLKPGNKGHAVKHAHSPNLYRNTRHLFVSSTEHLSPVITEVLTTKREKNNVSKVISMTSSMTRVL